MGVLFTRDWQAPSDAPWQEVGPARGDIAIDAERVVKLVMSQGNRKDLSPFTALRENALHSLVIIGEGLTDEGLAFIQGLRGLQRLDLVMSLQVTDEGLAHLRWLGDLKELTLDSVRITDEGLAILDSFPHLTSLSIARTGVSNAGLAHVKKLKALRRLDIRGTKVTPEALIMLGLDMPNCQVVK